jgi:hypothetical protein
MPIVFPARARKSWMLGGTESDEFAWKPSGGFFVDIDQRPTGALRPPRRSFGNGDLDHCLPPRHRPHRRVMAKFQSLRGVSSCKREGLNGEDGDRRIVCRRSLGICSSRAGAGCIEQDAWRAASRREETSRWRARRSTACDASQGGGLSGRVRLRTCGSERFRSGLHPVPTIWRRWWWRIDVAGAMAGGCGAAT